MGTEQLGLSPLWMESADLKVRIPMHGVADSLNVATATTLLLSSCSPKSYHMKVLYVDNHLLAVVKEPGLPTQPVDDQPNLLDLAKAWVKKTYHKPGAVFLEPIHRLDTPVSGLVLFARTSKALSRLQEMMRNQEIKKFYLAWIEGFPPPMKGPWNTTYSTTPIKPALFPKTIPGQNWPASTTGLCKKSLPKPS